MEDMKLFQIGEVAKMFQISVGTLRHYEQAGLLSPEYTDPKTGSCCPYCLDPGFPQTDLISGLGVFHSETHRRSAGIYRFVSIAGFLIDKTHILRYHIRL